MKRKIIDIETGERKLETIIDKVCYDSDGNNLKNTIMIFVFGGGLYVVVSALGKEVVIGGIYLYAHLFLYTSIYSQKS